MPKAAPGASRTTTTTTPRQTAAPRRAAAPTDEHVHDREDREGSGSNETGNAGMSKADAFNAAKAGGVGIPVGDWEARIIEMVYEKSVKGESVKVTFECITTEEDSEAYGKKGSQWYQIFDKEGNLGKGVGFLKADFEKLGVPEEKQEFSVLEETLAEITAEMPLVNIKVKKNDQWTNIYIQGLVEGQDRG